MRSSKSIQKLIGDRAYRMIVLHGPLLRFQVNVGFFGASANQVKTPLEVWDSRVGSRSRCADRGLSAGCPKSSKACLPRRTTKSLCRTSALPRPAYFPQLGRPCELGSTFLASPKDLDSIKFFFKYGAE